MLREKSKKFISSLSEFKKTYFTSHKMEHITGIDINSHFIKLLTSSIKEDRLEIEHFAISPLPTGTMIKNEIKDPQTIANLLKKIIAEANVNIKFVALAVNRSAAIIKNISVDKRLSRDEIESRVWIEASRLFPNLVSDIYLDFAIIGPAPQDDTQLDILLVACRKQQMQPYLEIMQLINLTPVVIDVNCYAFERALIKIIAPFPNVTTVALLNIDFSLITLIVMQDKNLIYTHELNYDGHTSFQETAQDKEQTNVLLNSIGLHLRHSMQFFYSSKPHTIIQKMVLTGDCAVQVPGLAAFIQNEMGIEVILPDLSNELIISPKVNLNDIKHHLPQLVLSCGLTLSQLNLYLT